MSNTRCVYRYIPPVPAKGGLKLTTCDVDDDDTFWMFTQGELDRRTPRAWLVAAITHGFRMNVSDHFRRDGTLIETNAFRLDAVNRVYAKVGGGFGAYGGTTEAEDVDIHWLAFIKLGTLVREALVFSSLRMDDREWRRVVADIARAAKADGMSEKAVRRHLTRTQPPRK